MYYFDKFKRASTPSIYTASSLSISIRDANGKMFIVIISIFSLLGTKTSALNNFLNNFSKF